MRNRIYARGRVYVESYGTPPVIVYAPEAGGMETFSTLPMR